MSQKLLNYIGNLESPNGVYDVLVGGKRKDLSGMTIGEVMKFQSTMRKNGHESTAVGRYQIIATTLDWVVKNTPGLTKDSLFTDATQDRAGTRLLERRGLYKYEAGKMDFNTFTTNLAKEWASLPVHMDMVNGKGVKLTAGDSYHKGVGSNKAHGSPTQIANIVRQLSPTGENDNPNIGGTTRTRPPAPVLSTEAPDTGHKLTAKAMPRAITPVFKKYLAEAENQPLAAALSREKEGVKPVNVRYKDSNGTDKVGYGHKLSKRENTSGYVQGWRIEDATKENIMELYNNDVTKAYETVREIMGSKYKENIDIWDSRRREMLIDVEFSQTDGVNDKELASFVRAVANNDMATAEQTMTDRFNYGPDGMKTRNEKRNKAFSAQFMGPVAQRGDYATPEGQREIEEAHETRKTIELDEMRRKEYPEATPQTVRDSEEGQRMAQKAQQGNTPPPMQPNAAPGYAAGGAAAPAATPLVNVPAPDIDLGGMLSKEYQSPTGEKGMLSTLPAPITQGVPDYVAPNG